MLSVRGEGILSWAGDDNFVVEDETVATHEVVYSFLVLLSIRWLELDFKNGGEFEQFIPEWDKN